MYPPHRQLRGTSTTRSRGSRSSSPEAEAAIAGGRRPAVAGDSYLEVGWYLEQLALTYDAGYGRLTGAQRERWAAFAEQTLCNVWNPNTAQLGRRGRTVERLVDLRSGQQLPLQLPARDDAVGAGGAEPALARLPADAEVRPAGRLLRRAAGRRLARGHRLRHRAEEPVRELSLLAGARPGRTSPALSSHTRDTIDYWVHATVPTRDRFAPIGDQSRSSIPELYDYHENLVHAAVVLSPGTSQARRGTWWLQNNSVNGVAHSFNLAGRPAAVSGRAGDADRPGLPRRRRRRAVRALELGHRRGVGRQSSPASTTSRMRTRTRARSRSSATTGWR